MEERGRGEREIQFERLRAWEREGELKRKSGRKRAGVREGDRGRA